MLFLDVVIWGLLAAAIAGGLFVAHRSEEPRMPAPAALLLCGGLMLACLLAFLWGGSGAPVVHGILGSVLIVGVACLVWFLPRLMTQVKTVEVEEERTEPSGQLPVLDRLQGIAVVMKQTIDKMQDMVITSAEEQSSGVLETTSVIAEMSDSIKGIADNTEHLSVSAEESSSSILEMGASLEEVSTSVDSLGNSVDDSVSSIEQMSQAIHDVAGNVEGLSEVAEQVAAGEILVSNSAKDPHRLGESRVLVRNADGRLAPMQEVSHFIRHLTRIERFRVYTVPDRREAIGAMFRERW